MVVKGEAIVIVLDVGKYMQFKVEEHPSITALEEAKEIIGKIIQRKIFSESKDEIALILIGDDSKIEDDDEDCDSKTQNIRIIQGLQQASWKLYELVDDIPDSNLSTDFMIDCGLDVAINLLQSTVNIKKIDSKRILLLSNFDGNGYFYSDRLNKICDELKASNIELNIIHPVAFPDEIKSEMCSEEFQSEIKAKCHVLDLLKEVNGESYLFNEILTTLKYYKVKSVQPMPSYVNLEIGNLTIPISVYMKITEFKPKSFSSACAHADGEKPKRQTTYCLNDEVQTRVAPEDNISAYKYGTTLVPFSEVDKKNMEYESGGKGMKLLGFTKASNIKRHLYVGNNIRYVLGHKNDESAKEALAAFAQALHDTKMVAIARFVSTARSAPVIGVLSPRVTQNSECLAFITLPYMEDIRHFVFTSLESDSKNIPSGEQLDAIDEFITSMDLTTIDDEEEGEILKPKDTVNPYVQRLFHCLSLKVSCPGKSELPVPPHILSIVNPEPKLLMRAKASFKKVKSLFPIKVFTPKKPSETGSNLFPPRNVEEAATKNLDNEESSETKFNVTDANLKDALTDKITEVGSSNPVRDIQYLTEHRIKPFDEICEQIHGVVNKFLDDCDRLRFNHPKVLSVLKEYRSASLKEANCVNYNNFMLCLQKRLLEKENEELWDKIKHEKLGLISNLESPSSNISSEKAEMYLSEPSLGKSSNDSLEMSAPCIEDDDDDDLMDQL